MSQPLVELEHVHKSFRVHTLARDAAWDFLSLGRSQRGQPIVALQPLDLQLAPGQSLGIVGANGSGKSTLLKLIAGLYHPSGGRLTVHGRVAGMLELGTGFHPELTGQENLRTYFSLFQAHFDLQALIAEARDFAELGDCFFHPFRTYSSGMQVRLAFAAALAARPQVFIVDEALAVGDAYFQQKCYARFEDLRARGVTLLFVSHASSLVERFCQDALYLDAGKEVMRGPSAEVVARYEQDVALRAGLRGGPSGYAYGTQEVRLVNVQLCDLDGIARTSFGCGHKILVRMQAQSQADYPRAVFSLALFSRDGVHLFSTNNDHVAPQPLALRTGLNQIEVELGPLPLHQGSFSLSVSVFREPQEPFWNSPADHHPRAYEFRVDNPARPHGLLQIESKWRSA